jgi:ribonuclease HI
MARIVKKQAVIKIMKTAQRSSRAAILYFDGGSRGNPGIAAGAAVLLLTDHPPHTVTQYLPKATNNEAEYTGLIIGLEKARELGITTLKIHGDSQLVLNQVKGTWKLKSENLRSFYDRARQLLSEFEDIKLEWIERAKNHLADAAANRCMDTQGQSVAKFAIPTSSEESLKQGETNLETLLRSMQPVLEAGEFVFCSVSAEKLTRLKLPAIGKFREREGITAIVRREDADRAGLEYTGPSRQITLSVHSSLDAVGFLATISTRLARAGIAVNVVSAYYHDHLFIPTAQVKEAMSLLKDMSATVVRK